MRMMTKVFLATLGFSLFVAGCKKEDGIGITIRPRDNITKECFAKGVASANKEIQFLGDRQDGSRIYFDFKMSDSFKKSVADLGIAGGENFNVIIDSWFKYEGEKLQEIKFATRFDDSKIEKLSNQDREKLKEFSRPFAVSVRSLPDRLFGLCAMEADLKNDIDVDCAKDLCTTPAPPHDKVGCFDTDTADLWEKAFCESQSGTKDSSNSKFTDCLSNLKADPTNPSSRCKKIVWLKQKTCPSFGDRSQECLTTKDFLKKR